MDPAHESPRQATRRRRANVELKELEDPFRQYCEANGLSLNQGLRSLVAAEMNGSVGAKSVRRVERPPAREMVGRRETSRVRVEIRLGESEKVAAEQQAQRDGFALNVWIASLVRSHLVGGAQFGEAELLALAQSNRELLAIGRNLNQIARALNIDANDVGVLRGDLIEQIRAHVTEHTQTVARLIAANVERWQVRG